MAGHDIIVVGASAGGVEALIQLVRDLPEDMPASIFITLHIPAHGPSVLPNILSRKGKLRAIHPANGETILPGMIYVAPPDQHLMLHRDGTIELVRGPRENGHRPAIDPLFRSAARAFRGRVIGVILSGTLDDGTAGLAAIKVCGGIAVAQDPNDALYPGMPRNAIDNVEVDHVLPVAELGSLLARLAASPAPTVESGTEEILLIREEEVMEMRDDTIDDSDRPGTPSGFGCPDCGGALWQITEEGLIRFRCRTGHAFSADTLLAKQSEALETALWVALRALEERADLAHRIAERIRKRNNPGFSGRMDEQAREAERQAKIIRDVLAAAHMPGPGTGEDSGDLPE